MLDKVCVDMADLGVWDCIRKSLKELYFRNFLEKNLYSQNLPVNR
jgi:hypothetical protein